MVILPRLRHAAIAFDWSSDGRRFRLPRKMVTLSKKYKKQMVHFLSACELRKSSIPYSGLGTFLLEPAVKDQIILKYGGRRISFKEADRLALLVSHDQILLKNFKVFLQFLQNAGTRHSREREQPLQLLLRLSPFCVLSCFLVRATWSSCRIR